MLKFIIIASIILISTFGQSEDGDELATVELNMETLSELSAYIDTYAYAYDIYDIYDDEIAVPVEISKTCKQIKKRKACLQAVSKAPNGIDTGRRGNDDHGECMYFNRKNNEVVKALGNQCLPALEVKKYIQANKPIYSVQAEDEDDDDADAVEMSESLFDKISLNAPSQDDIKDDDMMKYCKDINKENICLRSTSAAPEGRTTGRRGNDGPGECMYFKLRNNPVVKALGNQCLPPLLVIKYKQQGILDIQDEDDINSVEISMQTWDTLSLYINEADILSDARTIIGCKTIRSRRECINKGVTPKAPNGMNTGRRGNDNPGECMYFKLRNNPIVRALGSRCLAPAAVKQYKQMQSNYKYQVDVAPYAYISIDDNYNSGDYDDGLDLIEIDSIEMDEGLFDQLSKYAPNQDDMGLIDADMRGSGQIVGCKTIRTKKECLNRGITGKAPNGENTGRRGNDAPGECMYFNRKNNPIVQALGYQCLAPAAVRAYKQNPPFDDDDQDDTEGLATVELTMNTFVELAPYIDSYDDEISAEMSKTCKQIKKKKACLQAFSKAPIGIDTGRRGNDSPGECMYFERRNNKVVKALGNQCLPANEVKNYIQMNGRGEDIQEFGDDEENDTVEMSEGLFGIISDNTPDTTSDSDNIEDDTMKYCKEINKEKICLRSTSKAPIGRTTGRRGNDGPGECMYFKRFNNPVVMALGNRCLAPLPVIAYVKANKPGLEMEFFVALGLIDQKSQEINYDILSMIFVMMIIIGFTIYYKLCQNNDNKYDKINDGVDTRYYQSV